jgi:ABC-type multidrug transport system fused ATPase/permease subunit
VPPARVSVVIRRLLTRSVVRRGLAFSALVLIERLLTPAAARVFFLPGSLARFLLPFGLAGLFAARTFARLTLKVRTEAELFERITSAVLGADVLRASVMPNEDARAELGEAVYNAAQSISNDLPVLAADGCAAAVFAVAIVIEVPGRMAALVFLLMLVMAAALLVTRRYMHDALAVAWTAREDVIAAFVDALEGRVEVVASGRRGAFLGRMHECARAWATAGARLGGGELVASKLLYVAMAVVAAAGVAGAAARWRAAVGITAADVALLASMTPAFSGVAHGVLALTRARSWTDMVARAVALPPAMAGGGRAPPKLPCAIAFQRVCFRYEGALGEALRHVDFAWSPGEVLAFTGPNGSGKSTCLRLLLALARPDSGTVAVAGVPLDEIDADAWRRNVVFLPQRPYLPARCDVRTAIHFLAPLAADEQMRRALDRVGLLASLEGAGSDPLGVRVDALSVGERQRVALARVLCCEDASLVLLDEPDANLDRAGIAIVAGVLRELARERMVAFVAHSDELVDAASRVLVLDRGRLAHDGESPPLAAP